MTRSLSRRAEYAAEEAIAQTISLDVRCPGVAHAAGGACPICDAERDGTVEVLLTHVERDAICCAKRGRPFDPWLAPRLLKLGLLKRTGALFAPTDVGLALLAAHYAAVS